MPKSVTFVTDKITENELEKILQWYRVSFVNNELILEDTWEILYNQKKKECKEVIISRYSSTDQDNINRRAAVTWDKTELIEMDDFINSVLEEFHTNWENADFTPYL